MTNSFGGGGFGYSQTGPMTQFSYAWQDPTSVIFLQSMGEGGGDIGGNGGDGGLLGDGGGEWVIISWNNTVDPLAFNCSYNE